MQRIWTRVLAWVLVGCVGASWVSSQVQAQVPTANVRSRFGHWSEASFPVENFQAYTSPYGYRRSPTTGRRQFHNGLDIAAPLGSYIRNWWGGEVVELSDDTACGTLVAIQSGRWWHVYCHLQGRVHETSSGTYMLDRSGGIQLWEGQIVRTGDKIGRIGMTGRTTGPHLHWGIKYDGKYLDPALVLREMYRHQTASRR